MDQILNEKGIDLVIKGHSLTNGAVISEDAVVTVTSNDETVATVPSPVPVPPGGSEMLRAHVTQVGAGVTDFHITVTPTDGSGPFETAVTLVLMPVAIPGLVRITAELQQLDINPLTSTR